MKKKEQLRRLKEEVDYLKSIIKKYEQPSTEEIEYCEEEKVIVLIAEGKGRVSSADFITVKLFDTKDEAEKFINVINDLEHKYWTYAEIVGDGVQVEPVHGEFY